MQLRALEFCDSKGIRRVSVLRVFMQLDAGKYNNKQIAKRARFLFLSVSLY